LASLLLGQRHWGIIPYSTLKGGILIGGFLNPRPLNCRSWYPCTAGSVDLPTLHVRGTKDGIISERQWKELVAIYKNSETYTPEEGHGVPESPEAIDRYIKFFRRTLYSDHTPVVDLTLGGISSPS